MKKINWTVVIVIILIISFLIGYGELFTPKTQNNLSARCQGKTLQFKELKEIEPIGAATSTVLMEVYSDYQCPACAKYYYESIKPLVNDYVSTNKIKLLYHDIAFEGNRSQWAAEGAYCANDQGKFWDYHNALLSLRYETNSTEFYEKASLENLAQTLGLDECEFYFCLESGKYLNVVKNNTEEALKTIKGTPTTFLNGSLLANEKGENLGAVPYETLKTKIDTLLGSQNNKENN